MGLRRQLPLQPMILFHKGRARNFTVQCSNLIQTSGIVKKQTNSNQDNKILMIRKNHTIFRDSSLPKIVFLF